MPLVRVTGVDADAFDISDVAKMNDLHSRKAWHSRRPNNNNPKHSLSPSDNTDETPSTDSSSMVSDREGVASSMGGRHSFASVNSSSTLLSNVHNAGNNNRSYNIAGSVCSNFDNYYDDPLNPFDAQRIPEEDEDVSSSAMEDCSLSGTVSSHISSHRGAQHQNQQQHNTGLRRTNSVRSQSTMSSSSRHHSSSQQQQQRHHNFSSPFREEDEDDITSVNSSIQTSSIRNAAASSSAYSSQLVTQLESQVAKLNLELAMTKSDLDQIQLENRKLHEEKSEWHKKKRLLQEENDQLRITIERMERDKLMRTMESTKGVGRVRTSMDVGSCVVWGGSSISGNTWADSIRGDTQTFTTHNQKLKQEEALEVPFRSSDDENRHTYKRAVRPSSRRSSFASTGSFHSIDDLSVGVGSVGSVNLSNGSVKSQELDEDANDLKSSLQNALGALRPMQRLQEIKKSMRENDDGSIYSSTQNNNVTNENAAADIANNNDEMGHIEEEEEYDDDDPFATWKEDRERLSSKKKWFQRGDGQKQPQSQDVNVEEEEITRANEECLQEDPFDTAKGEIKESEYTSFAGNGNHSDSSLNEEDLGSVTQQPRRGTFRLPWQRGQRENGGR
mmetsp:Transcript_14784/g.24168  ORF Transcript_14784/g.24168 Transcript_14784/m.24168 type:complete len:615 (+) Transcript_14784:133-1977(+)